MNNNYEEDWPKSETIPKVASLLQEIYDFSMKLLSSVKQIIHGAE